MRVVFTCRSTDRDLNASKPLVGGVVSSVRAPVTGWPTHMVALPNFTFGTFRMFEQNLEAQTVTYVYEGRLSNFTNPERVPAELYAGRKIRDVSFVDAKGETVTLVGEDALRRYIMVHFDTKLPDEA